MTMRGAQISSQTPRRKGAFRKPGSGGFLLLMVLIFASIPAEPAGQEPVPSQMSRQSRNPFDGFGSNDPVLAARQMRALNADRQKSLVSDTDKLLKLAQDLNSEIETSNQNALTQVELRKIADIEKLARNVKQKMSISFVGELPLHDSDLSQGR
jgi:hypothetical protein